MNVVVEKYGVYPLNTSGSLEYFGPILEEDNTNTIAVNYPSEPSTNKDIY